MGNRRVRRRRIATVVVALAIVAGACGKADKSPDSGATETTVDAESVAFGHVTVSGTALPDLPSSGTDPAVGMSAPVATLDRPGGETGTIGGAGRPTLVVFVAHWCPHCQREVPLIVSAAAAGKFGDVRLVAVATGTNPQAPNFPPVKWLNRENWSAEILLDNKDFATARAFGLSGYPYLVAIDAEGTVKARRSGELPVSDLIALAHAAAS